MTLLIIESASTIPGQRMKASTRMPPSVVSPLPPRKTIGVKPDCGEYLVKWPLSPMTTTISPVNELEIKTCGIEQNQSVGPSGNRRPYLHGRICTGGARRLLGVGARHGWQSAEIDRTKLLRQRCDPESALHVFQV